MKRSCVFVGPSLAGHAQTRRVDILPPATRGALTAALKMGYTRIGLVDGEIAAGSRLPLHELKKALALPHVELVGGASVGAILAAQLQTAGMRGIGRIFRLFRRGSIAEHDEVYVLHAPAALRYRCLGLPLINIRYTLRAMRRRGYLRPAEERAIVDYLGGVPWFDRDRHSLSAAVYETCARSRCNPIVHAFDASYRDIKREDALAVLSALSRRPVSRRKR